jgi:hypothetical protein
MARPPAHTNLTPIEARLLRGWPNILTVTRPLRREFPLPWIAFLLFVVLGCATSMPALADDDEWRNVAGEWRSHYTNSVGDEGKSALSLHEDSHGNLSGTWDGIPVRGDRINGNAIELRGRNDKRSYQITGTREGRVMILRYLVTRLDSSGVYDGTAKLRREH